MCLSSPSVPPVPEVAPPPAPAKEADPAVKRAQGDEKSRVRAMASPTVATSPMGVTAAASTTAKKLTGQ